MVGIDGDIAIAGEGPVGGWSVRLTDATAGTSHIHLTRGGLAASRGWNRGAAWRTVTVVSGSCQQARAAADRALRRSADSALWLGSLGVAARLTGPDGSVVLVGHWPGETTVAA